MKPQYLLAGADAAAAGGGRRLGDGERGRRLPGPSRRLLLRLQPGAHTIKCVGYVNILERKCGKGRDLGVRPLASVQATQEHRPGAPTNAFGGILQGVVADVEKRVGRILVPACRLLLRPDVPTTYTT